MPGGGPAIVVSVVCGLQCMNLTGFFFSTRNEVVRIIRREEMMSRSCRFCLLIFHFSGVFSLFPSSIKSEAVFRGTLIFRL